MHVNIKYVLMGNTGLHASPCILHNWQQTVDRWSCVITMVLFRDHIWTYEQINVHYLAMIFSKHLFKVSTFFCRL